MKSVSELDNNCKKKENLVLNEEQAVYLNENYNETTIILNAQKYTQMLNTVNYNEYIEKALDESDMEAQNENAKYYTHDEIFSKMRRLIDELKI